jgi:hypothetical protein
MATAKQLANRIKLNKKTKTRLEKELRAAKLQGKKLQSELVAAKKRAPAKKKSKTKKNAKAKKRSRKR